MSEWISVEDRLPIDSKPVLSCCKGLARQGVCLMVASNHNGFWFLQNSEAHLGYPNLQYTDTHRQPLPEPPKE